MKDRCQPQEPWLHEKLSVVKARVKYGWQDIVEKAQLGLTRGYHRLTNSPDQHLFSNKKEEPLIQGSVISLRVKDRPRIRLVRFQQGTVVDFTEYKKRRQ